MAYTTINKSTAHFNTKLYTGNGSTNNITGVGFQPDWLWIKSRGATENHVLYDAIRGVTKQLYSNTTGAESTNATALTAFASDGFNLATTNANTNANSANFVSWNWKANGQGSSNTDGTINSTYTSANTTAGFSIVKWTGNGSAGATVGHGLGSAPKVVITKRIDGGTNNWVVGHSGIGFTELIYLNSANAKSTDSGAWNNTAPSPSVFTVGSNNESNGNGYEFISYCFAEKTGYSKFGNYIGNGNANGPFIYTGFRPTWVMIKETSGSGAWRIFDSKRGQGGDNIGGNYKNALMADVTSVEESGANNNIIDALSNGFKLRYSYNDTNGDGGSYIYMAIGQSLVGSNDIPCTAR